MHATLSEGDPNESRVKKPINRAYFDRLDRRILLGLQEFYYFLKLKTRGRVLRVLNLGHTIESQKAEIESERTKSDELL